MNLTKNTILALGLIVTTGVSFAQNTTTDTTPVGVLGQSYSEVHFGANDITHFTKDQYGLGVAANVPVTPYLDLNAGYDYAWIRGLGHVNSIAGAAIAHTTFRGVKPFFGGGLGYDWNRPNGGKDNLTTWGVTAGVAIPVSVVTITPRINYADDFRGASRSSQQTTYAVETNYWVSKSWGVFGSVGYTDVNRSSFDAWDWTAGARFKF
jgi:hypothetical protein